MLVKKSFERFFRDDIADRGREYASSGAVTHVKGSAPDPISFIVEGSSTYVVSLIPSGDALGASCDCPFAEESGEPCKHIFAALEISDSESLLPGGIERLVTFEQHNGFDQSSVLEEAAVSGADWRLFFGELPSYTGDDGGRGSVPNEIAYAIHQQVGPKGELTLDIMGRREKPDGTMTRWVEFIPESRHLDSLDPFDGESIGLLMGSSPLGSSRVVLTPVMAGWWLKRFARSECLWVWDQGDMSRLEWEGGAAWEFEPELELDSTGEHYRIGGDLAREDERIALDAPDILLPDAFVLDGRLSRLHRSSASDWLVALRSAGSVRVPVEDHEELLESLLSAPSLEIPMPGELTVEQVECIPTPGLEIRNHFEDERLYYGEIFYRYGSRIVAADDEIEHWREGRRLYRRKGGLEKAHEDRLRDLLEREYPGFVMRRSQVGEVATVLAGEGWELLLEGEPVRVADKLEVDVSADDDWFEIFATAEFGDQTLTLEQILKVAKKGQAAVTLEDGSTAFLSTEWAVGVADLIGYGETRGNAVRFKASQALLLDELIEKVNASRAESFQKLRSRMSDANPKAEQEPSTFKGELRSYQREGLGWFRFLREIGSGGCLADDMGLGKTVQVLALLESIRGSGVSPSLVVAPRSVLHNWRNEAERFTPKLKVEIHHGSARADAEEDLEHADVVLTTYGTLRRDEELFSSMNFNYVILDEAQAIKNPSSQVGRVARTLKADHRLALSGTPVENHLIELWSLFDFLNAGMLGTSSSFSRTWGAKNAPAEKRDALGKALRPLILRRTKKEVASELPERTEQTLFCELKGRQKEIYHRLRQQYRDRILGVVEEKGLGKSKMQILEALLRLRQAACHPGLIDGDTKMPSAKLELLFDELDGLREGGHKALVFSQFTSFLAIVRDRLDRAGVDYCYLDGQTRRREEEVARFQSDDGPDLFLVSLKAGGLGLNLTNADYVFLLDPWWNPAAEAQAIDRAHRIGQTRPVVAHRLIAKDTIEERILRLQESKRELAESIVTADNSVLSRLDMEDLKVLLD